MLALKRTNSDNPHFRHLVPALDAELRSHYKEKQDEYDKHNVIEFIDTVVVAYKDDMPVGCGCFKKFDTDAVEIKRMFVKKDFRGQGIAFAILKQLEEWAMETGYSFTMLETGNKQIEAINLYKKMGYTPVPCYGPYVNLSASICMKKAL